ncbi:MAG TPA: permease-like cell division protein FtsX [Gaiellaceae bacterium]|jgi:cell division transport system permease protein
MTTGRFRLLLGEAWRSLGANVSTTIAATLTVLIGMFLLGLFIALGTWTLAWSNHVKSELLVKVYFNQNATPAQESAVARMLNQSSLVKSGGVTYCSKACAWKIMQKRYKSLTDAVPANPFPDGLNVTPLHAENVDKLYASITGVNKPAGVDYVIDGKKTSHKILQVAHVIEVVFTIATIVLLVASVLLISNTIRLSIFSRRREIEVMKLVGASNWFVRGPFMIEGLLTGFAGAILSILFLILGKAIVLPAIGSFSTSDVHAWPFSLISLILLGMGLGLGALGSGVTIRRFLQV